MAAATAAEQFLAAAIAGRQTSSTASLTLAMTNGIDTAMKLRGALEYGPALFGLRSVKVHYKDPTLPNMFPIGFRKFFGWISRIVLDIEMDDCALGFESYAPLRELLTEERKRFLGTPSGTIIMRRVGIALATQEPRALGDSTIIATVDCDDATQVEEATRLVALYMMSTTLVAVGRITDEDMTWFIGDFKSGRVTRAASSAITPPMDFLDALRYGPTALDTLRAKALANAKIGTTDDEDKSSSATNSTAATRRQREASSATAQASDTDAAPPNSASAKKKIPEAALGLPVATYADVEAAFRASRRDATALAKRDEAKIRGPARDAVFSVIGKKMYVAPELVNELATNIKLGKL